MYDIVAIGELLIDFAPVPDQTGIYPVMKANPGGAPANFLAALSKYGAKTAFIGKVGADSFEVKRTADFYPKFTIALFTFIISFNIELSSTFA